ncbi:MAG: histidinol-phosphatase [Planctomycetota bacterium]
MGAPRPELVREWLEFAIETAQLGGTFTLGLFRTGATVESKSNHTPVTAADRGAEERMRARIEAHYPSHGIVGEEYGEKRGEGPARWFLDPIDGTVSFIHGVPLYSTLVGLEWEGSMLAGVIHLPALGETVYAARGLGCYANGRRVRVSTVKRLEDACLLSSDGASFARYGREADFHRLRARCRVDRTWGDAYGYAMVATGRAEIMVDAAVAPWDVAAVLPIIEEAGGHFHDWDGRVSHQVSHSLATNAAIHAEVVRALAGE